VPRSLGGPHTPSNLVSQCSSCHAAHHDGRLRISGTADQLSVERPGEPRAPCDPASPSGRPDAAAVRNDAVRGLTGLGWAGAIAVAAVEAAIAAVGPAPLEAVIREALRRCPRPAG
jgi:hypothetical protein